LSEQFAEDPGEGEGTTRRFASMPAWWLGWKAPAKAIRRESTRICGNSCASASR